MEESMKYQSSFLFLLSVAAILALSFEKNAMAQDQASWLLSYQGKIIDSGSGAPMNDQASFIFTVTNGDKTPVMWTETDTVMVKNGLFHVLLGQMTPFPATLFDGTPTKLKVSLNGKDVEPATQLSAVPFAFYAQNAGSANSADHATNADHAAQADNATTASKAAQADKASDINDGVITAVKIADGSVSNSKLASDPGSLAKVTNGAMQMYGGNVGFDGQIGHYPLDAFKYQGITMGHYTLGWVADPMGGGNGLVAWLSGYAGIRLFTHGSPALDLDINGSVYVPGNFSVGGTKSALVDTKDYGKRLLYAVEAPENKFTDEGKSKLIDGKVIIKLDPIFQETIEGDLLVHLTPYGKASLFVAETTSNSFTVEAMSGDPNIEFAWQVSAHRKGYGNVRLEQKNY
jgi:hypothetical protein